MPGTAQTAKTLVNSEPGPITTWSAAAMASRTASGTGGLGGSTHTRRSRPGAWATFTWPTSCVSVPPPIGPSCSAHRTTATDVAGRTRARAPRS